MTLAFHELRYWSIMHDARVMRLSALGADGRERFALVPMDCGSLERRRRRSTALDQLEQLVRTEPPGEVMIELEDADV